MAENKNMLINILCVRSSTTIVLHLLLNNAKTNKYKYLHILHTILSYSTNSNITVLLTLNLIVKK